jgi:type VII secretion protein EccB
MASRRDLFQSYQFSVQRVVSGLVLRETDPAQSPLRRMGGAVFAGVMITVLSLAVVGVIGVISPGGNTSWQDAGAVIVEKETGARFVWLQDSDGDFALHPVTNFASAALLTGTTQTVDVSRASLADAPRGPRLGLVDAPDSLPPAQDTLGAPWTLCSLPVETRSGEEVPSTALVIGEGPSRGAGVGDRAVLVRDAARGTLHMVVGGYQYPIPVEAPVLEGLTLRQEPVLSVGTAWLSALPAGRDLAPAPVAGRGVPSAAVPAAVVGQVRVVQSPQGEQYYQVGPAQLLEITRVQALLLLADPAIRAEVYGGADPVPVPLSAADATAAPRVDLPEALPTDPPAEQPEMAEVESDESTVCASFSDAGSVPQLSVQAGVDGADEAAATSGVGADGTALADRVMVAPGRGAIVESMTSPAATRGTLSLVTDSGRRYALPASEVVSQLGYGGVTPVQMPASLVDRIPAGAALDPEAARGVA